MRQFRIRQIWRERSRSIFPVAHRDRPVAQDHARLYLRDPGKFDLVDWLKGSRILTDDVLQIAIVGRDGTVKLSTWSKTILFCRTIGVSDYYMAHVDAVNDHLVIGKPTIDGATEQWVLPAVSPDRG